MQVNKTSPKLFKKQLRGENLIKIPGGGSTREKFDISKTVIRDKQSPTNDYSEDLRSMRSEFNYDKKKNFVELLGQKQIQSRTNGGSGLHQFHNGQQVINDDDGNFRRDKHHGRLFASPSEKPTVRFHSVSRMRKN